MRYCLCVSRQISRSEALADAPEGLAGALFLESSRLSAVIYTLDPARSLLVAPSVQVVCEARDGGYA